MVTAGGSLEGFPEEGALEPRRWIEGKVGGVGKGPEGMPGR